MANALRTVITGTVGIAFLSVAAQCALAQSESKQPEPYASIAAKGVEYSGPGREPAYDLTGATIPIGLIVPLSGARKADAIAVSCCGASAGAGAGVAVGSAAGAIVGASAGASVGATCSAGAAGGVAAPPQATSKLRIRSKLKNINIDFRWNLGGILISPPCFTVILFDTGEFKGNFDRNAPP